MHRDVVETPAKVGDHEFVMMLTAWYARLSLVGEIRKVDCNIRPGLAIWDCGRRKWWKEAERAGGPADWICNHQTQAA